MAEVFNDILIGYPWEQAFDLPAGFILDADQFRAEFRRFPSAADKLATITTEGGGIVIGRNVPTAGDPVDRLTMKLTKAQTAAMREGSVRVGPVLIRATAQIPLGVTITIPVSRYVTRPADA